MNLRRASIILLLLPWCLPVHAASDALSPEAIRAASRYSTSQHATALIVMQHGKTLLREFPNGRNSREPVRIYSGTKFFWCLAALAAQNQGILDLDEKASDTITEWRASKTKSRLTLRQLLNFTSGMPAVDGLHEDGLVNRNAIAIRQELSASPNSRFIYGPAAMQVFHEVLRRKLATRSESSTHFLEQQVLRPLGLGPQRYLLDRSGNPLLAAGFKLTADEWLRMGQLILHGGKPVVSSSTLHPCLSGTEANPAFSLGLWNNHLADEARGREVSVPKQLLLKWPKQDWHDACLCKQAPADLIASIGSYGQRLYVVPSLDLVVLRQGESANFSDITFLRLLFNRPQ